ncbi:hypothetical protein Tco_0335133 [Tanacetum coccineum]
MAKNITTTLPHLTNQQGHVGNPFDVHWARKINGRDDLDWAPLKMNGQDDVELLLTKETHYMSCLSKQTQEEETRKKT